MATSSARLARLSRTGLAGKLARPLPLRGHLVVLLLSAVVPLVLFCAGLIVLTVQHEREAFNKRLADKSAQLASAVDAELARSISMLQALGASSAIQNGDLRSFHGTAQRIVAADPAWANLLVIGPSGEHLLNARQPYGAALPPFRHPELPAQAAATGKPVVSQLVQGVVRRGMLTAVYVPIMREGAVVYVLSAALEPENWQAILGTRMAADMNAVLRDRDSNVIAVASEREAARIPPGQPLEVQLHPGSSRAERVDIAGVAAYANIAGVRSSGWSVVAHAPAAALEERVWKAIGALVAGFGLLVAAGIWLASGKAQAISRSVTALVEAVNAAAAGRADGHALDSTSVSELRDARAALTRLMSEMRVHLEREESMRLQLQAHEESRNAFLAMLGHELRNPLAPIHTSVHVLKRVDPGSEQGRRAVQVIERQTSHLNRLVEDMLDVTRVQRGTIELRHEPLNLAETVRHVVTDHAEVARLAQVDLRFVAPEQEVTVVGDAGRLSQVVRNLLHNALKFTPAGGHIDVRVGLEGPHACVRVCDTGTGIAPGELAHIFEPFVQGDQQQATRRTGLGLGLALVKSLVELHGGRVRAESAGAGHGAEFVIELPTGAPGQGA